VRQTKADGYDPKACIEGDDRLRAALELIGSGFFSPDDPHRFKPVIDDIYGNDQYLLCADFQSYWDIQQTVSATYRDPKRWATMVAHNLANVGRFSSDRTIKEYAEDIWKIEPVKIVLDEYDADAYVHSMEQRTEE
jgi:starch phosphorylase